MVYCTATGSQYQVYMKLCLLLALEQTGGRTGALLSKNIDRAVKSLHTFFSDCVRSLEWCTAQRQVPSIKFT
jgi:hypothetical protein